MSDKNAQAAAAADTADAPNGRGKKRLLLAVGALVLLAGGYTFLAPKSADAADQAAEPAEPAPGDVVVLEPITLNLADGRFLKVGIALQLVEGVAVPAEEEVAGWSARALDDAISFLGSKTYNDLVAAGGRDTAKAELSARVAARYPDEVLSVYFTEIVMQ